MLGKKVLDVSGKYPCLQTGMDKWSFCLLINLQRGLFLESFGGSAEAGMLKKVKKKWKISGSSKTAKIEITVTILPMENG